MQSQYSNHNIRRALQTLESIEETIAQIVEWNRDVDSTDHFYQSPGGMQLLAANCTLLTAIGEGVNRIDRVLPDFLQSHFPEIPWRAIVGMRNHIAHGYFELDADVVFEAVKVDIPPLADTISSVINLCKQLLNDC